ncbi:protein-L-isoaspartate O-methyltransferase family protein [Devosia sp.]|uniref:protein-L-isoaspartate O-methyltransferase family protein n=1 Tax=Devosia sp. TaxID=1871048 RepID=UPI002EF61721
MIDFERARKVMVESQLRTSNVSDKRLLVAMGQVPRERFVPEERRPLAYIDGEHPLQPGRSRRALPAPAPFARLVQLAGVEPQDRVLDLGCGTGYSTAVLAALAAEVVGVEEHPELAAQARENLAALGIANAAIVEPPLAEAPAASGHFDVVIVEGTVDVVPEDLFARLADGGRLVALVRKGPAAVANLFVKSGKEVAARADFDGTLPPLADREAPEPFVF